MISQTCVIVQYNFSEKYNQLGKEPHSKWRNTGIIAQAMNNYVAKRNNHPVSVNTVRIFWCLSYFYYLLCPESLHSWKYLTFQGIHQNRKFKLNNFSMSNNKSDKTNKITCIDIIQKGNVIFFKGTLPRTISNTQSKMHNRPKCRNVSKRNFPMSNSRSENIIRFAGIGLL